MDTASIWKSEDLAVLPYSEDISNLNAETTTRVTDSKLDLSICLVWVGNNWNKNSLEIRPC